MDASPHPPAVERCRATVLFADIVGFSDLSEEAGTELAYTLVTGALRLLDGIARRHGAAVDKYMGDALMAVFGWPVKSAGAAAAHRDALGRPVVLLAGAQACREQRLVPRHGADRG